MVRANLADGYAGEWDSARTLAVLKRDGDVSQVPALAAKAVAALAPADHNRLVQRVTALGMTMAANRPAAEATMWVRETVRLLSDLPEGVLLEVIDDLQRTSKFLPTVAEIRERAEPIVARRRKEAARLDAWARLIASGADIPPAPRVQPVWSAGPQPFDESTRCTPEQAAAIMAEMGLKSETRELLRQFSGPPRKPTRADYIALGVDPAVLDQEAHHAG